MLGIDWITGLKNDEKEKMDNIVKQHFNVTKDDRLNLMKHNAFMIWFTGLSGSGKSTISNALEEALHKKGVHTYTLDGDNVRSGLNNNLGFSAEDRTENIRRIAEVSNLMIDAGLVLLASFVSPYEKDRQDVAKTVGKDNYIEIFVDTPLEECERRDVKGLYQKARKGEIANFTGIDSAYEAPSHPDMVIKTTQTTVEEAVELIINYINPKLKLNNG